MTDDVKSESSAAAPDRDQKLETASKPKRTRAKKSAATAAEKEPAARGGTSAEGDRARKKTTAKSRKTEPAAKAAPKKKPAAKRKPAAIAENAEPAPAPAGVPARFEDPIGDVSDGEAWTYTGEGLERDADTEAEAYRAGVAVDAVDGTLEPDTEAQRDEQPQTQPAKIAEEVARARNREDSTEPRPPARLERLQKILSQAGVASRRHAEQMIVAGRVAVNGQVVTALGSKADPEHDHIRVDGKLLHGAERHRYFVLNKPRGYVTTVSDPEGRPTVMEFVSKLGERVYPVGRLDYQSEGLLLMTNDGALANQLTRASAGVEKVYLVKVAGQPDEEELERLRSGVMIERGGPSSSGLYGGGGRVRAAPARVRQIRAGDNPWYEVVLTEGRNRELRKMFSAIGHYVEKIRRAGYGPLALDVEPGKLRELTLEEVEALRQTAEGKLKPKRLKTEAMLPKEAGRPADSRPAQREGWRPSRTPPSKPYGKSRFESGAGKGFRGRGESKFESRDRPPRQVGGQPRPAEEQPVRRGGAKEPRKGFDPRREVRGRFEPAERNTGGQREQQKRGPEDREFRGGRPNRPGTRWEGSAGERPFRPQGRSAAGGNNSRFGGGTKSAGAGRSGSFSPDRGARRPGGFAGKGKPGGFRAGPRPGGRHPGGKRSG